MVLENERGVPLASPVVLERLRQIDETMDLRPYKLGDNGIQWAVTTEWPSTDKRWARVQCGELPRSAAFDIICWVPLAVSQDEIPAYVERGLVGLGGSVEYVHKMLSKIRTENAKAPAERWAKVEDKALEMFEANSSKASPDVIKVASAGIPTAPPKVKNRFRLG